MSRRRVLRRTLAMLLALLVLACLPGGGRWQVTLPGGAGGPPALPVTLDDRSGLVTGIGPPPAGDDIGFPDGVSNLPGRTDMLVVSWTSGACTERTEMLLESTATGYRLRLAVVERPGGCIDIGYGRVVAISLSAPIDARSVEFIDR